MKTFKKINFLVLTSIIVINIFDIIKNIIDGHLSKLFDNGALFLLLLVPFLIKKVVKINLNELFKFLYYIYIILLILIGSQMSLIKNTLWFDKIIHCYFGFLIAIVAILIMKYNKLDLKKNIIFNIIFIMGFTMLIANCWEFLEYTADKIFDSNNQRWKQTCVNDTMIDLLVAFLGCIVISMNYFIEVKTKKAGLVFNAIKTNNVLK